MDFFRKLTLYLLILFLAACATHPPMEKKAPSAKMDSVAFDFYHLRIIASDADNVRCDYGPQRVADYDRHIGPDERAGQNGTRGFYVIYREMKCTWADGSGNRHKALLDMPELLKHMHVEWDHVEGETVIKEDPLQSSPEFRIEIQGKRLTVTSEFTVQFRGKQYDEKSWWVTPHEVHRKLLELTF